MVPRSSARVNPSAYSRLLRRTVGWRRLLWHCHYRGTRAGIRELAQTAKRRHVYANDARCAPALPRRIARSVRCRAVTALGAPGDDNID